MENLVNEKDTVLEVRDLELWFNGDYGAVKIGREHPLIVTHPRIVRGGKVQLRYGLEPEGAQAADLLAQLIRRERTADTDLGMAVIADTVPHIDQHRVDSQPRELFGDLSENVAVKAKLITPIDVGVDRAVKIIRPLGGVLILPHIRTEVQKTGPDHLMAHVGILSFWQILRR